MQEWMKELTLDDLDEKNREIAEVIGIDKLLLMLEYFGGTRIYFNKLEDTTNPARIRKIREECNGYNKREIIKKYNLTDTRLDRILKQEN